MCRMHHKWCPYSRVPNITVGNPYSFFGAFPSYMALFGTSRLLNFMKSSFLHFYSECLPYWFFIFFCTTLQLKVLYQIIGDLRVYWWIFDFLDWRKSDKTFIYVVNCYLDLHFYWFSRKTSLLHFYSGLLSY